MNKLVMLLCAVSFFLTTSNLVKAEDRMPSTIDTQGKAEKTVPADFALLTISLEEQGKDPKKVTKSLDKKVDELSKASQKMLGIQQDDIKGSNTQVQVERCAHKGSSFIKGCEGGEILTHRVSKKLILKVEALNKVSEFSYYLSENSIALDGVSYDVDDRLGHKKTVIKDALAAATEKAKFIAETAGVKLKKPYKINSYENVQGQTAHMPRMAKVNMLSMESGPSAPSPDMQNAAVVKFTANVNLSYEIE